jgi:hypothetical protein
LVNDSGNGLLVELLQFGFEIEALELRGPARHAKMDDALRLDRKVRLRDDAPPFPGTGLRNRGIGSREQGSESDSTKAIGRIGQKGAAVDAAGEGFGIEVHDQ